MDDKKIILAIDDNRMDLVILNAFLSQKYDLRVSKSATDALIFLTTTRVDLILLDIAMPDMSGLEFLHQLRLNPQQMQTPVIIVSSHDTPEFIEHALKNGANDYISKPVNSEVLQEKITAALNSPRKKVGIFADL
jgi:PleD family two-component response regulator